MSQEEQGQGQQEEEVEEYDGVERDGCPGVMVEERAVCRFEMREACEEEVEEIEP